MAEIASLVSEFVIPELGSLVSEALSSVLDVVKEMRENEAICRRVYERMKFVNEELEKITDAEALRQNRVLFMYGTTLNNFLKFLNKHKHKNVLKRLAGNRKMAEAIQEFHADMDELFKLLNLANMAQMAQWRRNWEEDMKRKFELMTKNLTETQTIHAEVQHNSASSLREAMVMLGFEINHMAELNSKEQLALMRKTFNKVVSTSHCKVPKIPKWFISYDDVDFDLSNPFDGGSYGNVYRGTHGKGSKVVIKCLLMDEDGKASESFFKEVDVWKDLKNPHVISLYGACHVSTPAFFVCEDAAHGNFSKYFEKENNEMQHKDQVWRLFYEAACGLYYLHKEKVVHGDLKCNNLLVGADHKAKICDFGFSYIRTQSVGLSAKAQTNTIRWKAPECLAIVEETPGSDQNPRFASDVFSLGMCIIEAFSGEPPYGIDDDDTILDYIFEKRPYPRPDGFENDEWELVEQMCLHNWQNRISLSAAMDMLELFAERAEDAQNATKECAKCNGDMPVRSKFCVKCGCRVEASNPAVTT